MPKLSHLTVRAREEAVCRYDGDVWRVPFIVCTWCALGLDSDEGQHRIGHGKVDVRALAQRRPAHHPGQDGDGGVHARRNVRYQDCGRPRTALDCGLRPHVSADGKVVDVVGGHVLPGAFLAETRDRAVDDAGVPARRGSRSPRRGAWPLPAANPRVRCRRARQVAAGHHGRRRS